MFIHHVLWLNMNLPTHTDAHINVYIGMCTHTHTFQPTQLCSFTLPSKT